MASSDITSTNLSRDGLRAHFGDRKLPDITRKITACVACRKQKIKCQIQNSGPPCVRCKRRGLSCTVNRSLQGLLEDDVDWKNNVLQRLAQVEAAVEDLANSQSAQEESDFIDQAATAIALSPRMQPRQQDSSEFMEQDPASHRPWDVVVNPAGDAAAIPGSYVSERVANRDRSFQQKQNSETVDLVAQGFISGERAQELFDMYHKRLDHFVYCILGEHQTLKHVRSTSPILFAAICSVSALQSASIEFDVCYQEYLRLCAARAFSKESSIEDVQAYCVGAFWLSEISWNLVGAAVRTATEIQLHRSIFKALEGDKWSYLRTRLFYLVYVCDHHFSIAYGRPPMTRECEAIAASEKFTKTKNATEQDARLVSQVKIWAISSRVFEAMGTDVDTPVSQNVMPQIRRFAIDLDNWRADWNDRFSHNANVGNYPQKGVGLHFHFAKLYLASHVFRGKVTIVYGVFPELDEIANIAIMSASSILTTISTDEEIQSHLNGLPSYFITMITFASIFLLKVALKYPNVLYIHTDEILGLIGRVVTTLRHVSTKMHPRHLLVSIADGLAKIQAKIPHQKNSQIQFPSQDMPFEQAPNAWSEDNLSQNSLTWLTSPSNMFLLESYDFLSFQDMPPGLDFDVELQHQT